MVHRSPRATGCQPPSHTLQESLLHASTAVDFEKFGNEAVFSVFFKSFLLLLLSLLLFLSFVLVFGFGIVKIMLCGERIFWGYAAGSFT